MPRIEGYIGICGACFEPIATGEEMQYRKNGRYFHRNCAETNFNSYYIAFERIRGQFEQGVEPTKIMNEMERIFKIPALNDPAFNEDNEDIIKLYREISDSRGI